jgi:hypothetical protein
MDIMKTVNKVVWYLKDPGFDRDVGQTFGFCFLATSPGLTNESNGAPVVRPRTSDKGPGMQLSQTQTVRLS